MTRNDFMNFFRDQESLNTLSPDDRYEVFQTILLGSSDITKKVLDDLISDYAVSNLIVQDLNELCYVCRKKYTE